MRRKDREQTTEFAVKLMEECEYATLATVSPDGAPYCIPISPVSLNGYIYFHCAQNGEKLDNISANNKICISCVGKTQLLPKEFSTEYESAVAKGICEEVQEDSERLEVLRALCMKFAPSNMDNFDSEIAKSFIRTGVYRITISEITAKAKII